MKVFDERIRSPVLRLDGRFCAVMLSLFLVALRQKKGRGVWARVNSYQREAAQGWGRRVCRENPFVSCSPTSASLHPLQKILMRKNSLKLQKVDLKNSGGEGEISPPTSNVTTVDRRSGRFYYFLFLR